MPATFAYFTLMELLQPWGYTHLGACGLPAYQLSALLSYLHICFQPISADTSRHWMPVRSTNGMPARAALLGARGLPLYGFGGSGDNGGEIAAQRS